MTAALLLAAMIQPDSPLLPAEPVRLRTWRGVAGPAWKEMAGGRLLLGTVSGRVIGPPWHWLEVHSRFGPLTDVTP